MDRDVCRAPSSLAVSFASVTFQKMTGEDFSPLRIVPPNFDAWLKVSQNREGKPCEARVKTFSPRYSFCVTRFAGVWLVQGFRQGATPDSNCLMIFSLTIS